MSEEIKVLVNKIDSLIKSHQKNPHELLYEMVFIELHNYNFRGITKDINSLPLYRTRFIKIEDNSKETDQLIKETDQLSYSKDVKCYGRLNRLNQSMLYCSEFDTINEQELLYDFLKDKKKGDTGFATQTKWEINSKLNLLVLALIPKEKEFFNNLTLSQDCKNYIKEQPLHLQNEYKNFYDLTTYYFSQSAKNNYSIYHVCSAITNFFAIKMSNIDGFIYPTVQGRTGYNIALRPHVIDLKMITLDKEVELKKWTVTSEKSINIDAFKQGKIINDKIIWEENKDVKQK